MKGSQSKMQRKWNKIKGNEKKMRGTWKELKIAPQNCEPPCVNFSPEILTKISALPENLFIRISFHLGPPRKTAPFNCEPP